MNKHYHALLKMTTQSLYKVLKACANNGASWRKYVVAHNNFPLVLTRKESKIFLKNSETSRESFRKLLQCFLPCM